MADARDIQDPQGTITLGPLFLGIQWAVGGTAQLPIGLWGKSGAGKAMGKGRACPVGGLYVTEGSCFSECAGSTFESSEATDAGANSAVSSSEEERIYPSSRRRFQIHCAKIWQNS